jgi:hypothetical protein
MVYVHRLSTVRGNSIRTRTIEGIASVELEIMGGRVHIAFLDGIREAAATARREEVSHLMSSTPGRDLERLEAFGPGRASVVPDIDSSLNARSAVSGAEGVDDEGRATGAESGHGCKKGGRGKLHFV